MQISVWLTSLFGLGIGIVFSTWLCTLFAELRTECCAPDLRRSQASRLYKSAVVKHPFFIAEKFNICGENHLYK